MRVLFVHQNFPGQFKHLAPALVAQGHEVTALTMVRNPPANWQGVRLVGYLAARGSSKEVHPWLTDFESKAIRGEAAFHAAMQLKASGYVPDIIVAHPGWGESLFLKDVWPSARLGIYCEFYYGGADNGFDPEFRKEDASEVCRLRLKNINNLLHFGLADAGISPTHWQASTFPSPFRERIAVIHDGVDTDVLVPNGAVTAQFGSGASLTRADEVITFVNRNLEPYRGYHVFMRALPDLLRRRPKAHVVLVGGDDVSYGARPTGGKTWKQTFLDEVRGQLDADALARIHFVGLLGYGQFVSLLQLSTVHVYLTYPFVLSWSLLEAMSVGCAIVASDTQPLHEAITPNETGRLVPFFDGAALVDQVVDLLESPAERARLGRNARAFAQANYDLKRVCLPRQLAWVQALAHGATGSAQ